MQEQNLLRDEWLENHLGIPCFKFLSTEFNPHILKLIPQFPSDPFFLTYKLVVPDSNKETLLIPEGFTYVNTLITYAYDPNCFTNSVITSSNIRPFLVGERKSIVDITADSFVNSRFHRDELIGYQRAEAIKKEWILSNLDSRTNVITYVIFENSNPEIVVGFISVLHKHDSLVIDLIAVRKDCRNRGVGRQLVSYVMNLSKRHNKLLTVGTQHDNLANTLYKSLGFKPQMITDIYHYWNSGALT